MTKTLQIIDNFLPDPMEVRNSALTLDYKAVPFQGHEYHGVGYKFSEAMPYFKPVELIEKALGCEIEMKVHFFRIGMTGVKLQGYIHADQNNAQYAGLIYLNLPHQQYGGTAFWTHNATGWSEVPDSGNDWVERLKVDVMDDTLWTQNIFVPMKFNRFITYPTKVFHSRYPNMVEADTIGDARLIYCAFFNRKDGQ